MIQIINIIMIYVFYEKFTPYSGLKIALSLAFFLLAIVFFILLKPDLFEEA